MDQSLTYLTLIPYDFHGQLYYSLQQSLNTFYFILFFCHVRFDSPDGEPFVRQVSLTSNGSCAEDQQQLPVGE